MFVKRFQLNVLVNLGERPEELQFITTEVLIVFLKGFAHSLTLV